MEPAANSSASQLLQGKCVLKVLHGKHQGKEKSLSGAVTLLGSEVGCDIRLNSPEVELLQCVIVETPHGYLVHNLYDCDRVRVNKEPIAEATLSQGDELAVGPFTFEVVYACPGQKPAESDPGSGIEEEREGMRIQAASVAAQQAELMEEEMRLKRGRASLEEKEQNLGRLLAQRQLRLTQVQRAVKARFARFKQEEAVAREELASREAASQNQVAQAETVKARFQSLRKRFKTRWRRLAQIAIDSFKAREKEQNKSRELLAQDRRMLLQDQHEYQREVENTTAELDLDKRNLREVRDRFDQEKLKVKENLEDWENSLASMEEELTGKEKELVSREKEQIRELARGEKHLLKLRHEEAGLEKRIQNRRELFPSVEILDAIEASPPTTSAPAQQLSEEPAVWMNQLDAMACKLDDQRLRLLEAWGAVEGRKLESETSQREILGGLEAGAQDLLEREELLEAQAAALRMRHAQVDLQEDELKDEKLQLEVRRMEIQFGQGEWEGEREILQARVKAREASLEKILQMTQSARHVLMSKAASQREELEKNRMRLEDDRQLANDALAQYRALFSQQEEQKQSLAIQELAIGRLALETIANSHDPAANDFKLDKIRREVENRFRNERKEQLKLRTNLEAALQRVVTGEKELGSREAALDLRAADLDQVHVLLEERKDETSLELIRLKEQEKELAARNRFLETRHEQLQGEIDRLYGVLVETQKEDPPQILPLAA